VKITIGEPAPTTAVARKIPYGRIPAALVERSIPAAFEEIAQSFPDRIAVRSEEENVTYGELDARADSVAHQLLMARGGNPETVALWLKPGTDQLVAILGALKAGKIVVLLDSQAPALRLQTIIEDSGSASIVADESHASASGSLAQAMGIQEIVLGKSFPTSGCAHHRPDLSSRSIAFIFYTSGSTGTPKGVIWDHRNVLHNVLRYKLSYHTGANDRITLLSWGTANSVMNMLLALLDGAMLVPFDIRRHGVNALAKWLLKEKISVLWLSIPLYRSFAATLTEPIDLPDLRLIRFSSDTVHADDIASYKKLFPPTCRLLLGLATSETGLLTTFSVDHHKAWGGSDVPVGYSVEDIEVFLSNADPSRPDDATAGEIVVRSDYLAPGYWRNPTLTAVKFKPDPLDPARRIYHTGDLGFVHADGYLVHKGRNDFRVKIRGYGVDLAEVEKALASHPRVRGAVARTQGVGSAEPQLVVYYVTSGDPIVSGSELRDHLSIRLADYMIPAKFIRMEEFPLTANGKIDRAALPLVDNSRPELDVPYAPPQTDCQRQLAQIWQEVLSLESVGINDDFLSLGGDSLKATMLANRVLQHFQLDLPIALLFECPTIAAMTDRIVTLQAAVSTTTF